jgi:hypothetical protein
MRMRAFSRHELMRLDDHELRNIGLTRADFEKEAKGHLLALMMSGGLIQPRLANRQIRDRDKYRALCCVVKLVA